MCHVAISHSIPADTATRAIEAPCLIDRSACRLVADSRRQDASHRSLRPSRNTSHRAERRIARRRPRSRYGRSGIQPGRRHSRLPCNRNPRDRSRLRRCRQCPRRNNTRSRTAGSRASLPPRCQRRPMAQPEPPTAQRPLTKAQRDSLFLTYRHDQLLRVSKGDRAHH